MEHGRGRLLGAALVLAVTVFAGAAALPQTGLSRPPGVVGYQPRIVTYQPRIVTYQPRIVAYQPRIVDETPKTSAPHTVTVFSDVLFAFDSAALSPQAEALLTQVVTAVQAAPAGQVVVTGYTDSIGDPSYNQQLSQKRAAAVEQFLAQQVSRPDLSYDVVGMGEADPVAPNTNPDGSDNPTGRAQNRRVTVTVPA
ncbi:OmpA family protein [Acidiferrimicrobium sp. IK]|uniref:OmpA family protein n=1 Tax=Acidiferrimicrobium sp. IK TaxID=2871700 RepID=UPI0021CAF42E|nr:OmpA family protein [Acidiferrimicrobium sp. IK]MCU4184347.1 OmpA family protein [Acidiferrimicrobium sp. IK]